jgi:general secretion pathway protein G
MLLRNKHLLVRTSRAGFTLMELLVVIAILVLLAGVSITSYQLFFKESKLSVAKIKANELAATLDKFAMSPLNGGNYPDPSSGFSILVQRGYLVQEPIDPWGQPYRWQLRQVGDGGVEKAVVWSCGPNQRDEGGGGDDITSD